MNVNSDTNLAEGDKSKYKIQSALGYNNKTKIFDHAPLAAPEDDSDEMAEYAQIKDVYGDEGNNDQIATSYPTMPHDLIPSKSKPRHRRDNKEQSKSFFSSSFSLF